jgi:FixJ family two-component response regulator
VLSDRSLISIVDDDQSFRDSLRRLLKSLGYAVAAYSSATEFLDSRQVADTTCLVADVHMAGMTGIELYCHLIEAGRAVPTILVTAYPDVSTRERMLVAGVTCYLEKPLEEAQLIACLRSAVARERAPPNAK